MIPTKAPRPRRRANVCTLVCCYELPGVTRSRRAMTERGDSLVHMYISKDLGHSPYLLVVWPGAVAMERG